MKFLRQTLAIAAKDLRSEIRGKEAVNASVSFALVILLLFSFAFDLEPEQTRDIAAGLLWVVTGDRFIILFLPATIGIANYHCTTCLAPY